MKKFNNLLAATLFIVTTAGLAQEKKPSYVEDDLDVRDSTRPILAKTEGSEFSIDAKLVDKIFEKTVDEEKETAKAALWTLGYTHFVPSEFAVENNYYRVSYDDNLSAIPLLALGIASEQGNLWGMGARAFFGLSYAYVQGVYSVESKTGVDVKDSIVTQIVPIELGSVVRINKLSSRLITPELKATGGASWVSQTGELDGMSQSFWVPYAQVGPVFSLFSRANDTNQSGFDGVAVSSLYQRSFASEQTINGWSFSVASKFML